MLLVLSFFFFFCFPFFDLPEKNSHRKIVINIDKFPIFIKYIKKTESRFNPILFLTREVEIFKYRKNYPYALVPTFSLVEYYLFMVPYGYVLLTKHCALPRTTHALPL